MDRRPRFRLGLSTLYLPFYDALCAELPPHWQPYSGSRTFDEQAQLFAKGRTIPPIGIDHRVTKARGGYSAHNYGCATDWVFYDEDGHLTWLRKEDPLWQEYVSAVKKVGLLSGEAFDDIDHNELQIACDWPHVYQVFVQSGMTSAQQHIESNLLYAKPYPVVTVE